MSKLSKVLSVLLAMVFVFSAMSIGVEAISYKDEALKDYNAIGKPILSTDQYASMAMDELDRMLAEENIRIKLDVGGFIKINNAFTSIDESLDSIVELYGKISGTLSSLGDAADLDFSAILNCPRRGETGEQDADIFRAVFQFLADNADILAKVPYGSDEDNGLNLGILSGFVDLSKFMDIPALAKEPIAKLVWPNKSKGELDLTKTIDEYAAILIDEICTGTYPTSNSSIKKISTSIATYVPGLHQQIDLLNDPVYDIIGKGVKIALDKVAIMFANRYIPVALQKFAGYSFKKGKDADGDTTYTPDVDYADNVNPVRDAIINKNFHLADSAFNAASWSNTNVVDHVNDIAGVIVKQAVNPSLLPEINWVNGNNTKLVSNIIAVAKVILKKTGRDLFASYIDVKTEAELDAMSEDEFIAYILRSILNGSIDDVYIDNNITSMEGVLFELVRSLAATQVPSRDYSGMTASVDNMIKIGLDIAAAALNGVTDMNLSYNMSPDAFANACMDWVIENYSGFVSGYGSGSGFEAVSYVFNQIIPANYLPYKADDTERDNLYDILYTDIVGNLINSDKKVKLDKILDLIKRNPDSELNNTLISMLLHRVVAIVNYIIPGAFPEGYDYDTLEGLLDADFLSDTISGLITGLNDRVDTLMPSLLPVVCAALGLSAAETFGSPYISLEDITTLDPSVTTSFYMYNGSGGINTNTRNKSTGKFSETPDKLYKYKINSVSTNIPGLTVSYSGGDYINGSTSKTFTFGGSANLASPQYEGQLLVVTINYDVYEETDTKMTTSPLTATTYSVISKNADDGDEQTILPDSVTTLVVKYNKATYISTKTKLNELNDITIDVTRDYIDDGTSHSLDSIFKVTRANLLPGENDSLADHGVTANTSFSVNTTRSGGRWEWHPYSVSSSNNDTLEPGIYEMQFNINAQGTDDRSDVGNVGSSHYIVVYDDYGLKSMVNRCVSANRQRANYAASGTFTASYMDWFDTLVQYENEEDKPDPIEVSVDASTAYGAYLSALEAAATRVYTPRVVNNYSDASFIDEYGVLAQELYEATNNLEACVSANAGGIGSIEAALHNVVPTDYSGEVDNDGDPIRVEYDHPNRTYFAREDYLSYTYSNFKKERRTAENVLDKAKEAAKKGETYAISPVDAAYITHRVTLYGDRLIRVVADKRHLAAAITKYGSIQRGDYTAESWADYTRALAFANSVNSIAPGEYYNDPDADNYLFLKNQGAGTLRQSKVNEARAQLIKAAKKLVVASYVDYTNLNNAIAETEATYENGENGWTAASWATFKTAYENALSLVEQKLEKSDENQLTVDNAATDLLTAKNDLVEDNGGQEEGGYYFDLETMVVFETYDCAQNFLIGLDADDPSVENYIQVYGGWDYEIAYNEQDCESTGAVLYIYDGDSEFYPDEFGITVVLYGDVDGNGAIEDADASQVFDYVYFPTAVSWTHDSTDEVAAAFAADTNHDGSVDLQDAMDMTDVAWGAKYIDQSWYYENEVEPFIFYN